MMRSEIWRAEHDSTGVTPACVTCYLAYDQLGSVRLVTDQNANVVGRHDYLPYGEEIPNGDARRSGNFGVSGNVTQMFTGQERDGGTATFDYFHARHFSAVLGRFAQADPANAGADLYNPQSWNAYGNVWGNPLSNTDPSGLDPVPVQCPDCTVTVSGGSLDDIGTYNYSWFYGQWGSTNLSSGGGSVFSTTVYGNANVTTASTPLTPAKTGNGTCAAQRLVSGIFGAVNLGLAAYKAQELPLVVAGLASTGAGASAAGVAAVYGTTSIFGQALTGTAQLYSAATGNYGRSAKVAQFGSVLSGPVLGLGTLVAGGSLAQAEKNANRESMFTAGTGAVDSFMKESFGMITSLADWSFTYLGMRPGSNCGSGN